MRLVSSDVALNSLMLINKKERKINKKGEFADE